MDIQELISQAGKHKGVPVSDRTSPVGHGEWGSTRAVANGKSSPFSGGADGHNGEGRLGLLHGSADGCHKGSWIALAKTNYCTDK